MNSLKELALWMSAAACTWGAIVCVGFACAAFRRLVDGSVPAADVVDTTIVAFACIWTARAFVGWLSRSVDALISSARG